jgi:glycosyltransferase involved in cell wall biosynthesis
MRFSTAVITVSSSSRRDILKSYHLPVDKVFAVDNGIDSRYRPPQNDAEKASDKEFAREQYGITSRFILAVGVLQPRKNLSVLAEAFGELCARGDKETILAFTGKAGWATGREDLKRLAAGHGGDSAASRVIFTGYVPDDALERLFRACAIFAYPSLFEGFGLPPLEAMASGAPTLSADAPAMNELLQEGAILISPLSSSAWADHLQQVFQDENLAERLTQAGLPVAARFTWERAARETVDVYAHALRHNS